MMPPVVTWSVLPFWAILMQAKLLEPPDVARTPIPVAATAMTRRAIKTSGTRPGRARVGLLAAADVGGTEFRITA